MLPIVRVVAPAVVILTGLSLPLAADLSSPIVGATGDPYLTQNAFQPLRLTGQDSYEDYIRFIDGPSPITHLPKLTPDARFAAVDIDGVLRTVVVDGEQPNVKLIADLNRNGDLTDDPVFDMTPDEHGYYSVAFDVSGTPARFATGGAVGNLVIHYAFIECQGHLPLKDGPVLFVLHGQRGHFDEPYDRICFDLNRDGALPTNIRGSDECFSVQDRFVRLDGRLFEFTVERSGSSLTLIPTGTAAPERVAIDPGNPAPDFSFVDLDGAIHRLSDYRGQTVLLYGWATWCGPCRQEMPALVQLYSQYKERGFEIIGVNKREVIDVVRNYVANYEIPWPQSLQGEDGPILRLYRIDGVPTTVLVDRDGTIVARDLRGAQLAARLESLLDDPANRMGTSERP